MLKKKFKKVYHLIQDLHSLYFLKKKKSNNDIIKIAFIVQMPEIWDKEKKVYELLSSDKRFETTMIVVPQISFKDLKLSKKYGDELDFFELENKGQLLKAYENDRVICLKEYDFDFVFYQRPYDIYLPKNLQSINVNKCSRVCFIPYGMTGSDRYISSVLNRKFIRNATIVFFDISENAEYAISERKRMVEKKLQFFEYLGYPSLDFEFSAFKDIYYKNIVWMPRWGEGSHFVDYKDDFLALVRSNKHSNFIFRPHPLLKESLDKTTEGASLYSNYLSELSSCSNILIDKNKEIEKTLDKVDVIITDYTSLFPLFFMMGIAVIYCPSTEAPFNKTFKRLIPGLYFANNSNELVKVAQSLLDGVDEKKKTRENIARTFYEENYKSSTRIVEYLAKFDRRKEN